MNTHRGHMLQLSIGSVVYLSKFEEGRGPRTLAANILRRSSRWPAVPEVGLGSDSE